MDVKMKRSEDQDPINEDVYRKFMGAQEEEDDDERGWDIVQYKKSRLVQPISGISLTIKYMLKQFTHF